MAHLQPRKTEIDGRINRRHLFIYFLFSIHSITPNNNINFLLFFFLVPGTYKFRRNEKNVPQMMNASTEGDDFSVFYTTSSFDGRLLSRLSSRFNSCQTNNKLFLFFYFFKNLEKSLRSIVRWWWPKKNFAASLICCPAMMMHCFSFFL